MKHIQWENGAEAFVDAVASASAAPGGGAASAVVAATGCGLCMMAVAVTIANKNTSDADKKTLNAALDYLLDLKDKLKAAAPADGDAYEKVVSARKLPKESKERAEQLQEALQAAAQLPVDTARTALAAIKKTREIEGKIWPVIMSDITCGKLLLKSAITCLIENVKANMPYIKDEDFKAKLQQSINFLSSAV